MIAAGCSVTRSRNKTLSEANVITNSGNVLEDVKNQNVTKRSFYLQKAEIEVISKTINEKFIATIKFSFPDRYLISLKTRTGIEGARIYISNDSIIVNDRINKKLYFVNNFYLEKNFGITRGLLALVFGDIVTDSKSSYGNNECVNKRLKTEFNIKGVRIKYIVDCEKRKSISAIIANNYIQNSVEIDYGKFIITSGILIPGEIEVNDPDTNTKIKIKIIKIESPWNGNFNFIPGNGYEIIELV